MNVRNFAVGVVLAGVVVSTAACGGNDDSGDSTPTSATSSVATATKAMSKEEAELTNPNKPPSAATLTALVNDAMDPKIPAKDKVQLVEGSEADPDLFNQLVKAKKDNPTTKFTVNKSILKNGPGKAKVKVEVKVGNEKPQPIDATIVFDKSDGRWKLSKQTVCPLLSNFDVKSPLCGTSPSGSKKKSASSSESEAPSSSKAAGASKSAN